MLRICAFTALLFAGCQSDAPAPAASSDQKLADCGKTAELLAMFELGPGPDAAQRRDVIARQAKACADAHLTAAEFKCIAKSHSTWEAIACAPRMFPGRATAENCKPVVARMREGILSDMPAQAGSAGGADLVDRMGAVMEVACREDNWPADFRQCVAAAKPGDLAGVKACADKMPGRLQAMLGDRLKPVVRSTQPGAPGAPSVAPPPPAPAAPAHP